MRTSNGLTQNGATFSRRDAVPQVRKFFLFDALNIENTTPTLSYGVKTLNILGTSNPFNSIINSFSSYYEQYRVRKVIVRAQCGKGFTNDLRIKSYAVTRVDVDNNQYVSTLNSLQSLINSENTVLRTFTNRGNILLGKYRPIQRSSISNLSEPILPSNDQWYSTTDVALHTWKGIIAALVIPEVGISPNSVNISLSFEIDVEFRGRVIPASTFALNTNKDLMQSPPEQIPSVELQPLEEDDSESSDDDHEPERHNLPPANYYDLDVLAEEVAHTRLGSGTNTI